MQNCYYKINDDEVIRFQTNGDLYRTRILSIQVLGTEEISLKEYETSTQLIREEAIDYLLKYILSYVRNTHRKLPPSLADQIDLARKVRNRLLKEVQQEESARRKEERHEREVYRATCADASPYIIVTSMNKINDAYAEFMMSQIF